MHRLGSPKMLKLQVLLISLASCWTSCLSQTYDQAKQVINDKLDSTVYLKDVRPKTDQSQALVVDVGFELISIINIDDVSQTFTCNGFLTAVWTDEKVVWDPSGYGGVQRIFPETKRMWRPRMVLLNTLQERDLFEDDHSPTIVFSNGSVFWAPGSVFPASCELDIVKFPFDEQTCSLEVISMNYDITEIQFTSSTALGRKFYVPHGEWELLGADVVASQVKFDQQPIPVASAKITFHVRRRPITVLLNVMLPVVFLSLLNILVFLIPVESGEKIGYGITVLLALAVFLSIVSSLLPSSSGAVPLVTIYLFCLLVLSVLTVVDAILIVFLNQLEEKEERCIKADENFQAAANKVKNVNRVNPISTVNIHTSQKKDSRQNGTSLNNETNSLTSGFTKDPLTMFDSTSHGNFDGDDGKDCVVKKPRVNKYRVIGKHIDMVCFVVFSITWVGLTVGFLAAVTT